MLRVTIILLVFLTTTYGENNRYLQKRLTGASSTNGPTWEENSEVRGGMSRVQSLKLYTSPPLTKPLEYRRNVDRGDLPNDEKGGKISNSDNNSENHDHIHSHDHKHVHDQTHNSSRNIRSDSNQQIENPENLNYPQVISTKRNTDNNRHTTERYNRDISPVSRSKNRLVPVKVNTTSIRNVKDIDPNRMVYPTEADINIVFGNPRQPQTPFIKPLNPKSIPRNCSFGLCDEVDDYPAEKILKIISRSKELQDYFAIPDPATKPDFQNRFGENEDTLCSTMVHTKFPQSAVNINNEERTLVNVGDYKQGIEFETCNKEGKPCQFSDLFPDNFSTYCKQKYTIRRLMAIGKEQENAVFDHFHLPSCCVCTLRRN